MGSLQYRYDLCFPRGEKKTVFDADELICTREIDLDAFKISGQSVGKRSAQSVFAKSGRYVKAVHVKEGERHFDIALDATLRAALARGERPAAAGALSIRRADLRKKRFKRVPKLLIVFIVDASDSMGQGTHVRMKAAKGAVLALLTQAHLRRYRVAMVAFRDKSAQVLLPPTASLALARLRLQALPTGGATPLAAGLMKAWRLIRAERLKDPSIQPLMVVISDGDANVAYDSQSIHMGVMAELGVICGRIGADGIRSIVIDTKPRRDGAADMLTIARTLNGAYHHIDQLRAGQVVDAVAAHQPWIRS